MILLIIKGLARKGGAEVSLPPPLLIYLIYLHSIFTSHRRACQDSPDNKVWHWFHGGTSAAFEQRPIAGL
jgi:hypothetical protein